MIHFFDLSKGRICNQVKNVVCCGKTIPWNSSKVTYHTERTTCPACLAWLANQRIKEIAEAKA